MCELMLVCVCRRSALFLTSSDHRKRKSPVSPFFLLVSFFFFYCSAELCNWNLSETTKHKETMARKADSLVFGEVTKQWIQDFQEHEWWFLWFITSVFFLFFFFRIIKVLLFVCVCVCVGPKMFLVRECDTLVAWGTETCELNGNCGWR